MSNQEITIKWSIAELGQYCSNVSAYVASTMAQDGNTFDIFVMTEDDNVTFLKENVSAAILALTPFFSRITPDNFEPINNDVEVGLSFVPRIEGGEYSRTELAYVDSLCKKYIANYILNAWYAQHNTDSLVAYFANNNLVIARDLKDALVRFIRPVRSSTSSIRKVTFGCKTPTTYKHVNNRSDFALLWSPKDNQPLPEFDYDIVFYTDGNNVYTVNSESEYLKPIEDEDGKVVKARIIFDFSREGAEYFNNGVLKYKMYGQVPDTDFPDGLRSFVLEGDTDVEIWDGANDTERDIVATYIPSYVKLTFDDLTEEDIQQLQTPALQAKAEWDNIKPTINKAISDTTAAIEGATTATESATWGATNAKAAATQARSQGSTAEERGRRANEAAEAANRRMVEIDTEFSNKMDEVDGKVATAETQFTTAISEINDAITNGERAVESIRGALTEVDNKIGEADTAILATHKATDDANDAAKSANDAAEIAGGVANDFIQAENQRVTNEEKRISAETARQNAENAREAAEAQRQTDTAKAISDVKSETTAALSDMQSKVNTAVGNANQAAGNTNQAIEKANVATNNANTAATNANTAANEAEEAAASANAAKESIQEELGAKAGKTGEYKGLTAGFAYEIVGDGQATSEKFSFRPTGGPNRNVRDGSARIEVLKGNSVAWNQLVNPSTLYPTTSNGIEFTVSNGKVIANGTATANAALGIRWNSTQGHIYAMVGCPSGGSESTYKFYNQAAVADYGNGVIYTETRSGAIYNVIQIKSGVTANNLTFTPRIYDLTQMFGAGNEPATVEQFYELLPEGVDINAYNEGEIVDAHYKAIKTTGFNQWDEQWEEGSIDGSTGNEVFNSSAIRSKGYIRVVAGAKYNIKCPSQVILCAYDEDYNYIGYLLWGGSTTTFTIPSNAKYIRFGTYGTQYGPTYNNDICINIAWDEYSALNGTYKPYKPFERDLSWVNKYFPATINGETKYGMRRAGNVADEIRFNSTTQQWEAVQRVGVVDLGDVAWIYRSDYSIFVTTEITAKASTLSFISSCNYDTKASYYYGMSVTDNTIYGSTYSGTMFAYFPAYTDAASFKSAMAGVMLNYELAEPIVTPITEDVNLAYDVADYGTEQLIVAEGAQSAPLSAEVVYEPNVLASIKQVAAMLTRLDALETAVATMQASAVATTNEE